MSRYILIPLVLAAIALNVGLGLIGLRYIWGVRLW